MTDLVCPACRVRLWSDDRAVLARPGMAAFWAVGMMDEPYRPIVLHEACPPDGWVVVAGPVPADRALQARRRLLALSDSLG